MFCSFIEVTKTVVKSVSDGLRDSESETQLNLNRPLRISPGPRHLSRPLAAISTYANRPGGEASVRVAEGTSHGLAIRGQGRAAEDHVSQPPAAAAAAAGKRKARDMNVRDAETFRAVQVEVTFMTVAAGGPIFGSDVLLKSLLLVR